MLLGQSQGYFEYLKTLRVMSAGLESLPGRKILRHSNIYGNFMIEFKNETCIDSSTRHSAI